MCGCASWIIHPQKVILLPEERIFTVPAGKETSIMLDGKPMMMTFPEDMKLVSPTLLVRQEQRLNNAMLDKIKANSDRNKKLGIIGSILAALAAGLGIFFKMKSWLPKISAKVDVK